MKSKLEWLLEKEDQKPWRGYDRRYDKPYETILQELSQMDMKWWPETASRRFSLKDLPLNDMRRLVTEP